MDVHLHTPTGKTYCGAPAPVDRVNGWTAYRSECTCPGCLATFPVSDPTRLASWSTQATQERATGHADAAHQGVFDADCEACVNYAAALGVDLSYRRPCTCGCGATDGCVFA